MDKLLKVKTNNFIKINNQLLMALVTIIKSFNNIILLL